MKTARKVKELRVKESHIEPPRKNREYCSKQKQVKIAHWEGQEKMIQNACEAASQRKSPQAMQINDAVRK
jgi:hypothetical protein